MTLRRYRRAEQTPARGFTLVEILVVVTMVALVTGVALALFQGVRKSLTRQMLREDLHGRADAALGVILRDLACAYRPADTNVTAFGYSPDDGGNEGSALRFGTMHLAKNDLGPDTFMKEMVAYEVRRSDALERRARLVRISQVAAAGGAREAPAEVVLADDVTIFDLRLFDGDDWGNRWVDAGILPQAARVHLTLESRGESVSLNGEILIACGHVITQK
ncbi:MAG: prepilin-type N-terminal cleavage/methylation domain-containing protein [Verrucomicrobia bacterium]|nr:prepilin-type N-terminal cleavage/methylation domain-containing protein [Verrucomicrobiota bacterium]MDA1088567.1 prepilin-type N-terminal cleavage/methylation domain-containing protein [Verrucomicrobiota bacterium]